MRTGCLTSVLTGLLAPAVLTAVALSGCDSARPPAKGVGSSSDGSAWGDGASNTGQSDAMEDHASGVDAGALDLPESLSDAEGTHDATKAVDVPSHPTDGAEADVTSSSDVANGCIYGATTHAPGATFASFDGCNICTCGANGVVSCTLLACADAGTTPACTFDSNFRFWDDGGFRAYADESRVAVPHTLTVSRDRQANAPADTCAREIPCSSATDVDVAEIKQALTHADVTAALAMTAKPFYGVDTRPSDGTVFMFERADGRGFSLGSGTAVPAGLRALQDLLRQAQSQAVASPACANLRP